MDVIYDDVMMMIGFMCVRVKRSSRSHDNTVDCVAANVNSPQLVCAILIKYTGGSQGYGAPNGHTDTRVARPVLSTPPTQAEIRRESLVRSKLFKV